ncbi:MAG: hypothetical protein AB7K71_19075 [Polyangiaceae bacterium]
MWRLAAWWFCAVLVGCSSPPKNPPDIAADTEVACSRTDASAWGQMLFRTDAWRDLAFRADGGDADAFDQIASYMQAQLDAGESACRGERIEQLRETARRLREAPRPSSSAASAHTSAAPRSDPEPGEVRRDDDGEVDPAPDVTAADSSDATEPAAADGAPTDPPSGIPTVRMGGDGRIAVYRRVMRQSQARFRRCYVGALDRQESIQATAIEFVIAPDGHVEKTSFEGGTSYFDRCMDATFKSLRFPEDVGRMIIRYPLNELPH